MRHSKKINNKLDPRRKTTIIRKYSKRMTILREIIVAGARIRSPSGIAEENLFTGSGSLAGSWRRPEPVSRATKGIDGEEGGRCTIKFITLKTYLVK